MHVEHEIRHGQLYIYVTAPAGTHGRYLRSAAIQTVHKLNAANPPEYVSTVTGAEPGAWSIPITGGEWKKIGGTPDNEPARRLFYISWPVPANVGP